MRFLRRASLTMIDRNYGHLARDGREHAIRLIDEHASARLMSRSSVIAQFVRPPAASRISGESKSASAAVCSARVALPANACR